MEFGKSNFKNLSKQVTNYDEYEISPNQKESKDEERLIFTNSTNDKTNHSGKDF